MITGEIVGVEESKDPHKNIIIWVCFTQDGEEIPFYRGAELLEFTGKKVWPLMSRFENFIGKTDAQVSSWIQGNIEAQIGNIIKIIKCKDAVNAEMIAVLKKKVGFKVATNTVDIPVFDGEIKVKTVVLKSDATYTEK